MVPCNILPWENEKEYADMTTDLHDLTRMDGKEGRRDDGPSADNENTFDNRPLA